MASWQRNIGRTPLTTNWWSAGPHGDVSDRQHFIRWLHHFIRWFHHCNRRHFIRWFHHCNRRHFIRCFHHCNRQHFIRCFHHCNSQMLHVNNIYNLQCCYFIGINICYAIHYVDCSSSTSEKTHYYCRLQRLRESYTATFFCVVNLQPQIIKML